MTFETVMIVAQTDKMTSKKRLDKLYIADSDTIEEIGSNICKKCRGEVGNHKITSKVLKVSRKLRQPSEILIWTDEVCGKNGDQKFKTYLNKSLECDEIYYFYMEVKGQTENR